ncbi:hypothetical protein MASR1M60_10580 [Rhodocyclaceae bacterium]
MAESHVVTGLVAKRAELTGLVTHHRQEIARIETNLQNINAAIKIFAPEYDLRGIRQKQYRTYSRLFKKGECYRLSLDTLREAGGKATTAAIAAKIVTERGFPLDQQGTVCDSVNNSLRYAERHGAVGRAGLDGISVIWKLI